MLRLKQVVLLLAMLPVCMMFHNNISNWHYHQGVNGQKIRHAHPFEATNQASPNPFKHDHDHSAAEMLFFEMITNISVLLLLIGLALEVFLSRLIPLLKRERSVLLLIPAFLKPPLRGPPFNLPK